MASDAPDTQDLSEGTHEPRECMACRGSGQVISNLGGSESRVECPWCAGSGLRAAEIDAQEHWGPTAPAAPAAAQPTSSPAASGEDAETD